MAPTLVRLAALFTASALTLVGATTIRAAGPRPAPDRRPPVERQDPSKGAQTLSRVCGACHSPERIVAGRRSRAQWDEVMEQMVARGAQITDADYDVLMTYLVGTYGRVNVNRSTPDDLVEVLGLSTEAAGAIVKYRKTNGDFPDFDALAKVPGLDLKRLESLRDAISF